MWPYFYTFGLLHLWASETAFILGVELNPEILPWLVVLPIIAWVCTRSRSLEKCLTWLGIEPLPIGWHCRKLTIRPQPKPEWPMRNCNEDKRLQYGGNLIMLLSMD